MAGILIGIFAGTAIWPGEDFLDFHAFVNTMLLSMFLLVVGVVLGWRWTRKLRQEEEGLNDRRWYCMKCGSIFFVDLNNRSSEPLHPRAVGGPITPVLSGSRRAEYMLRVQNPVQRARELTARDLDGLRDIGQRVLSDWQFDPSDPWPMDLGIVSRLASKGCISYDHARDYFLVTDEGRKLLSTATNA